MSEQKSKDYDSVDLTEDEDSSGGNSEVESPFHFVDCSSSLNESISAVSGPKPPANIFETVTPKENSNQTVSVKTISDVPPKPSSENVQPAVNKKVGQFSSIQIKPPTKSVLAPKDITQRNTVQQLKTGSVESGNESESVNHISSSSTLLRNSELHEQRTEITLPEKDTIYSPKQPPGKVVIIKKNNKYYKIIIPHNVMPNINKSMGPVLINIPEVGPLVISNDPQAAKEKFKAQQLSLNLDDVDQNSECESLTARKLKDQALRDKKFCWTFNTCRKRDLEGFSMADRLGFNKTEARKAKMCEKVINSLLNKFRLRLTSTINEYEKFNKTILRKDKIKLVKINSIIKANRKTKKKINKIHKFESSTNLKPKKQEISNLTQSNSVHSTTDMDDYDSDLLVTKKVVILNSNNKEIKSKRPMYEAAARRKSVKEMSRKPKNFKIRPCYVQISRDKRVEEAYVKYCKEISLNTNQKPDQLNFHSLLPKVGEFRHPMKRFVGPNHVSSKQNKMIEKTNMLLGKVIYSEEKLEREMNAFKPFLIETEQTVTTNRNLEHFCNEFSKNNIIFIVNSKTKFPYHVLQAEGFISAVEIGYIKLVEADLFAKFAMNGMMFLRTEVDSHRAEHNYSLVKN